MEGEAGDTLIPLLLLCGCSLHDLSYGKSIQHWLGFAYGAAWRNGWTHDLMWFSSVGLSSFVCASCNLHRVKVWDQLLDELPFYVRCS